MMVKSLRILRLSMILMVLSGVMVITVITMKSGDSMIENWV